MSDKLALESLISSKSRSKKCYATNKQDLRDEFELLDPIEQAKYLYEQGHSFFQDKFDLEQFILNYKHSATATIDFAGTQYTLKEILAKVDYKYYLTDERDFDKTTYHVQTIILIALLSLLSTGECSAEAIKAYWRDNLGFLHATIPNMPAVDKIPSSTTIWRIVSSLDPVRFKQLYSDIFTKIEKSDSESLEGYLPTVVFDGQEVRASYKKGESSRKIKGANIISLVHSETGHVIDFAVRTKKNQEVDAFVSCLSTFKDTLDNRGIVFSADALNTREKTLFSIAQSNNYYLMPIKKNGSKELLEYLDLIGIEELKKMSHYHNCSSTKQAGRIDSKEVYCIDFSKFGFNDEEGPKLLSNDIKYLCLYISTQEPTSKKGKASTNVMYYISNLALGESSDKQIVHSLKCRWACEVMHHTLDTSLINQDKLNICNRAHLHNRIALNKFIYEILNIQRNEMQRKKEEDKQKREQERFLRTGKVPKKTNTTQITYNNVMRENHRKPTATLKRLISYLISDKVAQVEEKRIPNLLTVEPD